MDQPSEPNETEVDAIIAEFNGDVRAAIRALLYDIAVLAADFTASVSRGFVRGRPPTSKASGERRRAGAD